MEKVLVKIVNHVGQYEPGTIVQVSEEEARILCRVVKRNAGAGEIQEYQNAMLVEDWEEIQKAVPVTGGTTVIETPKDPVFEAKLAAIRERVKNPPPVKTSEEKPVDTEIKSPDVPSKPGVQFAPDFTETVSKPSDEDVKAAQNQKGKQKGK